MAEVRVVRQSDGCPEGHVWNSNKKKCLIPSDPKVQVMSAELYDLRFGKKSPGTSNSTEKPSTTTTTTTTNSGVTFSCPANNNFVFCNKKIPNASTLTGVNITTNDWQTCQRKCLDHGEACQSWAFSKSGKCQYGTSRDYSKFAYAEGWIAGPRHDPDSRASYNENSGENSSSDDDEETTKPAETSPAKKSLLSDWRVILAIIVVLMCSLLMLGLIVMVGMKKTPNS